MIITLKRSIALPRADGENRDMGTINVRSFEAFSLAEDVADITAKVYRVFESDGRAVEVGKMKVTWFDLANAEKARAKAAGEESDYENVRLKTWGMENREPCTVTIARNAIDSFVS